MPYATAAHLCEKYPRIVGGTDHPQQVVMEEL